MQILTPSIILIATLVYIMIKLMVQQITSTT